MMRAWAAISAAAVLVALPLSVQQAAGDVVRADLAAPLSDGAAGPAEASAAAVVPTGGITSSDIGVLLWLSVAVVAAVAAFLVLRRSRAQFAAADADDASNPVSTALRPHGSPASSGTSLTTLSFVPPALGTPSVAPSAASFAAGTPTAATTLSAATGR